VGELPLPPGLTGRRLGMQDAGAVFEVAARQEQHDVGTVEVDLADIVADWQRPSFEVGAQTVGVLDGDTLVAYGEYSGGDRGDAAVHPSYRRRGIGTAIAAWMRDRARSSGATVLGSPVPAGSDGDRLLAGLGYRVRWTSWVLALPEDREVPPRTLPDGYVVREAATREHLSVHILLEDAFLEWSDRPRESWDDFRASTVDRPGFAPWHVRVVTDPDGEVVGAAVVVVSAGPVRETFVDRLAVRRDHRHRGLAQVLLGDAFARGREHAATRSVLSTDSRTGALDLYLRVGMEVTDIWLNRAVDLR
jgi:mycothiol synthase